MIQLRHDDAVLCFDSTLALGPPGASPPVELDFPAATEAVTAADPFGLGDGILCVEHNTVDGVEVARETWRPGADVARETWRPGADVPWLACRLRLVNRRAEPVEVAELTPLRARGADGLRFGATPVGDWVLLRQPRHKNDMPACVRLGDTGPAVFDAVRGSPETGGQPQASGSATAPTRFVSSELTVLRGGGALLCLGVMPLDRQLVRCQLQLTPARTQLQELTVVCECDGQLVDPGDELVGQWVLAQLDDDLDTAVERNTAALQAIQPGARDHVARGERPPSVWCSWYYYGDGFTAAECEENLAALERRRLPIDVVQLDECWDTHWGDWQPNVDWPDLGGIATRIRRLGYRAGIWVCPVLAEPRSRTRYANPHWLLRDRAGEPVRFQMNHMSNFVLDPTHPEAAAHIEAVFRRLRELGFDYFKLDFLRAVGDPGAVFHEHHHNRATAYRQALEAVRRGAGEDAYVNVCGGFYGPSLGLAEAQRSGSDVRSEWPAPPEGEGGDGYGPFTIKQNTLRWWMNRLWDNDPDALMVRRREQAARDERLSLGRLDDDEARTCALNQYLGGGLVCFTENLAEIDDDRLLLLRHCVPSVGAAAIPRQLHGDRFPAVFDTEVTPTAGGLAPWHTISVVNWFGTPRELELPLAELLPRDWLASGDALLVSAQGAGWTRSMTAQDLLRVGPLPAHGCEVVKVQHLDPTLPALLWTDGHFSMGGTEVTAWETAADRLRLRVDWPWPTPLRLCLQPPAGTVFVDGDTEVQRDPETPCEIVVDGPGESDHELRWRPT